MNLQKVSLASAINFASQWSVVMKGDNQTDLQTFGSKTSSLAKATLDQGAQHDHLATAL